MDISTVTPVNVPADRAWEIIAEGFGDTAEWAASLSRSDLDREQIEVGATRTAQAGRRTVREKITRVDRDRFVFAYELVDPPPPAQGATNTWTITPKGTDRCEVANELHMSLHRLATPLTPLLKFAISRQLNAAIEEFCVYAETGTPHQRKLDARQK